MEMRLKRKLYLAVCFGLAFTAWLLLNHATPWVRKVVSDFVGLSIPLLGVYWVYAGTLRSRKREWGADLTGVYLLFYAIGMGCWTYLELIAHQEAPFPSIADAFYIPAQLFLMAGILSLPFQRTTGAVRGRALLDGLMVMTATIAFSWYFVLGPNLMAMGASPFAKVVSIAYPLSDLAMLVCLFVLSTRTPAPHLRRGYCALALGVMGIVTVDSIYGYMALKGTYASGNIIDVFWPFCQLLIAWGVGALRTGLAFQKSEELATADTRNPVLWRSLLPYLLVPPLAVLLVYVLRTNSAPKLEVGVYFSAASLVGLILLRQVFALVENNRLYAFLKEAYRDLEAGREELQAKTRQAIDYAERLEEMNTELTAMQAELLGNNFALEAVNAQLETQKAELAEVNAQLETLATTDGMTGLPNHRTFQERLQACLAEAESTAQPLSLLLIDVDRFKQYNDSFGHPAGDAVLRGVGQALRSAARKEDFSARYGGEEFAVILPDTDAAEAVRIAERFRAEIEDQEWENRAITASIGVATLSPEQGTIADLITGADTALYHSKRRGRNRVTHIQEDSVGAPEHSVEEEYSDVLQLVLAEQEQTLCSATERIGNAVAEANQATVEGWSRLLTLRDQETENHTERVTNLTVRLARAIGMTEEEIRYVYWGALLHDIGKIGVPDSVLLKAGSLEEQEWEIMRRHPVFAYELLSTIEYLRPALDIPYSHHERWDGTGYPQGLQGEDIPLAARLFSVVDVYDALTSTRSYRQAWPEKEVRHYLQAQAGTHFDPRAVKVFLEILDQQEERRKAA